MKLWFICFYMILSFSQLTYAAPGSTAYNYNHLLKSKKAHVAIDSLQTMLDAFHLSLLEVDVCSTCPTNLALLDFQQSMYDSVSKEILAFISSFERIYIVQNFENQNFSKERALLSRLTDQTTEMNFEPSMFASRIVSNYVVFSISRALLTKLKIVLKEKTLTVATPGDNVVTQALSTRQMSHLFNFDILTSHSKLNKDSTSEDVESSLRYWETISSKVIYLSKSQVNLKNRIKTKSGDKQKYEDLTKSVSTYLRRQALLRNYLTDLLSQSSNKQNNEDRLGLINEHIKTLQKITLLSKTASLLIDSDLLIAQSNSCSTTLSEFAPIL